MLNKTKKMSCITVLKKRMNTLAFEVGILWLSRWKLGPSYIDAILFSSRLIYTALVEVNFIIIMESNIPKKRAKAEPYCLIHCTDDNGKLVSPNSLESWKTLREAGEI